MPRDASSNSGLNSMNIHTHAQTCTHRHKAENCQVNDVSRWVGQSQLCF